MDFLSCFRIDVSILGRLKRETLTPEKSVVSSSITLPKIVLPDGLVGEQLIRRAKSKNEIKMRRINLSTLIGQSSLIYRVISKVIFENL